MRKLLATAAALAPLMAASGMLASGAQAEVVISTARTTPVQTSTATGTAADDVRLASGGSVAVTSGAAVTVDSNNGIDLDSGSNITMNATAGGSTGILVNGGVTGAVANGGAIGLTDSLGAPADTDGDGDLDGPFADGSARYGVRLLGAHTGAVLNETTGNITVEGADSVGVSIEGPQSGAVTNLGAISVVGDNVVGFRNTGAITGNVLLGGSVAATGKNAVGVAVDGAVTGRLQVQGAIASTGYRYTTAPSALPAGVTNGAGLYLEDLDADDLLQGGSAMRIGSSVSGGVLFDAAPAYLIGGAAGDDDGDGVLNGAEDDDGDGVKNSDDTDRDGDGILDTADTTASLTSYGAAPTLLIGSTASAVNLGVVGTGALAYGLVNRGTISAFGVYGGVSATGVQIGVAGGQPVAIAGGFSNPGGVGAQSIDAAATGIDILAGSSLPVLDNAGSISAQSTSALASAPASAIVIQAGASVPALNNAGAISAGVVGAASDAYAVRDLSGTLSSVTNSGSIGAAVAPADTAVAVTGSTIALDLRANTTGVTLTQVGNTEQRYTDFDSDGVPDATDPDDDNDGVLDAADTADDDDDNDGVLDTKEPTIKGDILLGSGADTLNIRNGSVTGAIAFGAGADALNISGGAVVTSALSDSDGRLDINVSDGLLTAQQKTALAVTGLTIGSNGGLIVTVDPVNSASAGFVVNGTASLADGSSLGVRFASLLQTPQRFTIIDATTLNYGAVNVGSLQTNSPYLYIVTAGADVAAGDVYVDARRRTAAEADLIPVEAAAFDAVYAGVSGNAALQAAFLSETTREGFINLYEQTLPDHSGGALLSLSTGVDAVTRALTGRNASAGVGETSAWVQEINFYADKDKTDSYGFRSEGFGVAGGVERGTSLGSVGVSLAYTSSDLNDPEAEAQEILSASLVELGLYWRAQGHDWTTWARAAGGYATFEADRSLVGDGLYLNNQSNWNGFSLALAGGASYERNFGRLNVRPEAYAEYFGLHENARSESGGGNGFDLDIDERDSHLFSAVAAVNVGYGFGTNGWIRPEIRVGWRQNISMDMGETIARYASGGNSFTLSPEGIEGGGPIAGFRLAVGNELGMLSINADAEKLEDYVRYTLLLRASFRF